MLIYRIMSPLFERKVFDWLAQRTPGLKPNCPECSCAMADVLAKLGEPTRIAFRCGHEYRSASAGLTRRDVP